MAASTLSSSSSPSSSSSASSPSSWAWKRMSLLRVLVPFVAITALVLMRLANPILVQVVQPPTDTTRYFNQVDLPTTTASPSHHYCSSLINSNTTVLFANDAYTWSMFHGDNAGAVGGENYVFASLDWALQQLGVTVVQSHRQLRDFSVRELQPYHRIFGNGLEWAPALNHPHIRCKHRPLHFWGNHEPTQQKPFDSRQIMTPYPGQYNTFLGFFVHSLVHNQKQKQKQKQHTTTPPPRERLKQGLLIGKIPELFSTRHRPLIEALIEDGFVLYSICQAPNHCGLPENVIIPPAAMPPQEYANFMSEMAFLIGFGDPLVSPSPLEGLAQGAAWLNPLRSTSPAAEQLLQQDVIHWTCPSPLDTQHNPIALLGAPYVYNIHLDDIHEVLQAANNAVNYRFSTYTPADFRPEAMMARVCAILEDDAICECPLQVQGGDDGDGDSKIHCTGNTYVVWPTRRSGN